MCDLTKYCTTALKPAGETVYTVCNFCSVKATPSNSKREWNKTLKCGKERGGKEEIERSGKERRERKKRGDRMKDEER